VKINIFQRFKYQINRANSTVLLVFEPLKDIDFQGVIPLLKMNQNRGLGCNKGDPHE